MMIDSCSGGGSAFGREAYASQDRPEARVREQEFTYERDRESVYSDNYNISGRSTPHDQDES